METTVPAVPEVSKQKEEARQAELKKINDKAEAKEKALAKKAKEAKVAIKYFFPKSAGKSYRSAALHVKAENHVYILNPDNPKYNVIKEYLDKHPDKIENGGLVFTVLSGDIGEDTDRGKLIDKLLEMDESQIRRVLGGKAEYELVSSKGQLIDLYLTQQEL